MESLMVPGTQLNTLLNSLGYSQQLGNAIGAALNHKVSNNIGVARNLLDVFSPLSSGSLHNLSSTPFAPACFCGRPYANYLRHAADYRNSYYVRGAAGAPLTLDQVRPNVNALLGRLNARDTSAVIHNLAAALQNSGVDSSAFLNPTAGFDAQIAQILQGMFGQMSQAIQAKLNEMATPPAPPRRRRKKRGLRGKLKRGFKKVGKSFKKIGKMAKGITKLGKGLFKGVIGGVKGLFKGNIFKGLLKLGSGLLGGLVGGPIGSTLINQIASAGLSKILGKKNGAKIQQVFGQMNKMFQVIGNIQGMNRLSTQGLSRLIRA